MYNFQSLPTHDWVTDYGFRRHMNQSFSRGDLGDYYQREKSHKSLLELIKYQSDTARVKTLEYFDLPADTREFLDWVYMWAAYQDDLPEGVHQDDIFPYAQLYTLWQRERGPRSRNVLVYPDRITDDTDGQVMMELTGSGSIQR